MLKIERGSGDQASPLKLFTNAKKKINTIFNDIGNYIDEFQTFADDVLATEEKAIVQKELVDCIHSGSQKVQGIKDMLVRDHMKVVFFGRTSNGKSTVINAMLWDKILPSGLGHTTNCFLSVEGCDEKDGGPYLLCAGSEEKLNVKSVAQLGHALSQESMSNDSLIRILWPKKRCALLKDEVVLVDSPGIDVTEDLDQWIDRYCLDADVFILVANAESTLMLAEKHFFYRVNERLSKPNIFILNNRWDASASEPELMEEVRQQHLERGISFLADELGVVTKQQAKDRVFFVSAKEALNARMQRLQGMPETGGALAEGFKARLIEFCNFERNFEECISRSATHTKFDNHSQRARNITRKLQAGASNLLVQASEMKDQCNAEYEELISKINFLEKNLKLITSQAKENITVLISETEHQVTRAMSDEIRRLSLLVDEFDRPFHQNEMVLRVYKAELYQHMEEGLGRNLSARCSGALQKQINNCKKQMLEHALPLLACKKQSEAYTSTDLEKFVPVEATGFDGVSFDMSYDINCASLCADFQQDIEFKFSLGFKQLIRRFLGPKRAAKAVTPDVPRPLPTTAPQPLSPQANEIQTEDMFRILANGYLTLTDGHSPAVIVAIGMLPVALWRTVGWRAVVFITASYGALYIYERFTWTSRAQERALKRQLVEHATEKLNLVISFTSSNCSHQVQQELSGTFAQICRQVEEVKKSLQEDAEKLKQKNARLDAIFSKAKTLKNKANWLENDVDNFVQKYLQPKTPTKLIT